MSWLAHQAALAEGREVSFRPRGHSMRPRIESGQLVRVSPDLSELAVGDIVFCRVKGAFLVHLLGAIDGERCLIRNNRGKVNGWISRDKIYGRVIAVED